MVYQIVQAIARSCTSGTTEETYNLIVFSTITYRDTHVGNMREPSSTFTESAHLSLL